MASLYKLAKQLKCEHENVVEEPYFDKRIIDYSRRTYEYSRIYCPLCEKMTYIICRKLLNYESTDYSTEHIKYILQCVPVYIVGKNLLYEDILDKLVEKSGRLLLPKRSLLNAITISKEEEIELLKILEKEGLQNGKGN